MIASLCPTFPYCTRKGFASATNYYAPYSIAETRRNAENTEIHHSAFLRVSAVRIPLDRCLQWLQFPANRLGTLGQNIALILFPFREPELGGVITIVEIPDGAGLAFPAL